MSNDKPKRKRRTKAQIEADKLSKAKQTIDKVVDLGFKKAEVQKKAQIKQPEGLGDKVEKITKATGIKAFVEYMNGGEPCSGCEKRKAALNKIRFRRQPQPLTEKDVLFIERIKDRNRFRASELIEMFQIHARLFNYRYQVPGNCASCVKTKYNDLIDLYKAYDR